MRYLSFLQVEDISISFIPSNSRESFPGNVRYCFDGRLPRHARASTFAADGLPAGRRRAPPSSARTANHDIFLQPAATSSPAANTPHQRDITYHRRPRDFSIIRDRFRCFTAPARYFSAAEAFPDGFRRRDKYIFGRRAPTIEMMLGAPPASFFLRAKSAGPSSPRIISRRTQCPSTADEATPAASRHTSSTAAEVDCRGARH